MKGFFLVYDLSTKSKQAKQKGRHRKREREKYRGRSVTEEMSEGCEGRKKRETECRSGLERLLHEGGLGSTANYA